MQILSDKNILNMIFFCDDFNDTFCQTYFQYQVTVVDLL